MKAIKQLKVAVLVDHLNRDLNGLILLGNELLKIGNYKYYLVPMNLSKLELKLINPDYILFPGYRQGAFNLYKEFKDLGAQVGFLETEGGFYEYPEVIEKIICIADKNFPNNVFSWGEEYKNICIKKNAVAESLIEVTGNPRFDVPFNIRRSDLDEEEKYILINTKFPHVNQNKEGKFVFNESYTYLWDESTQRKYFNKRNEFILTIKTILETTDFKIKLRPHPFESDNFYKTMLKEHLGIRLEVFKDEDIYKAIRDSWCVLSTNCTTSYDAHVSNIISLNLKYLTIGNEFNLLKGVSIDINCAEELIKTLKSIKSGEISKNKKTSILKIDQSIFNSNGMSSFLIANSIRKSLDYRTISNKDIGGFSRVLYKIKYNFHPQNKILKSLAKLLLFKPKDFLKYACQTRVSEWKKTYKYFNLITVEKRLKYLNIDSSSVNIGTSSDCQSIILSRNKEV